MNQRNTCRQHMTNKIMFTCLERGCDQMRLFCFDCRNLHSGHNYVPFEEIQQRFFAPHNADCEKTFKLMEQKFSLITSSFYQFLDGLKQKFIYQPDVFNSLEIIQQHQVIGELIKFKAFDEKFMVQVKQLTDQMIELLDKLFREHTLNEVQYVQIDANSEDQAFALYLSGTDLMETKQFNKAAETLKLSVHANPKSLESRCALGNALMQTNEYEGAQKQFQQALSIDTKCLEALYGVGEALVKQRKFKDALQIYDQIYQKDQTTFKSLYGKVDCLVGMGSKGEAIQVLNKILRISPNCLEAKRKLELLSR